MPPPTPDPDRRRAAHDLALALSGGAPAIDAQTGGTLVIGLDQEPPTLDPHASPSAVSYQVIASVTQSLLYKPQDGKLARVSPSWTTPGDGRAVTFKLRRDVKFHDGTPFNADAVIVDLRPHRRPEVQGGGAHPSSPATRARRCSTSSPCRSRSRRPTRRS